MKIKKVLNSEKTNLELTELNKNFTEMIIVYLLILEKYLAEF